MTLLCDFGKYAKADLKTTKLVLITILYRVECMRFPPIKKLRCVSDLSLNWFNTVIFVQLNIVFSTGASTYFKRVKDIFFFNILQGNLFRNLAASLTSSYNIHTYFVSLSIS